MNDDVVDVKRSIPWRLAYRGLLKSAGENAGRLHRSMVGLCVAAATQGLAFACLFPLFSALTEHRALDVVLGWLAVMTLLTLMTTIVRWRCQGFEFNGCLARTTHSLRMKLGGHLRRIPLETLQDARAGEMNTLLISSVDENLNYTIAIANMILVATMTPCVVALTALWFDWRIGLILLLVFLAILPIYRWRKPTLERGIRDLAEANQRLNADLVEFMQGLPVLRAARVDGAQKSALDSVFQRVRDVQLASLRKGAKPDFAMASTVELGLQIVVILGVTWVVMGSLGLSVVAAVVVIVARFSEPMATLIGYWKIVKLITDALMRIEALCAIEPLPLREPARTPSRFDLRFDDVTFQYAHAKSSALAGFNASMPMSGMTALVGPSGSGKSTIMRLALHHADPLHGAITIGGVDVRHIPEATLNGMISVVFQDVYLFDDTVLANIRMARPDATDEEVMEVARAARCDEFIERLPQGWQTVLGEIGNRLSGGERQRISIARALLKNAPIVFLDEPTSALDVESELAVQRAIDVLVRDRTVVVITHRLSTIVGADKILVIDDGKVVQQGRHDELIEADGRYRSMWVAQTRSPGYSVSAG